MNPPAYVDQEKTIVEKYLFTPGKLSSLTNFFAKVNDVCFAIIFITIRCTIGQLHTAKCNITQNAAVAKRDERIFNAIEAGDAKTLEYVLEHGGDPDTVFVVDTLLKSRWSALHQSCQKGHYDCAKVLIEKGNFIPQCYSKY